MRGSVYKFLSFDGFRDILENRRIKFSSLNYWKKNEDINENYVQNILEDKNEFNKFVKKCKTMGFSDEEIWIRIYEIYICSHRIYAFCTSDKCSSRSKDMWETYAKGHDGIRLKLDLQLFEHIKKENKEPEPVCDFVNYGDGFDIDILYEKEFKNMIFRKRLFYNKIEKYKVEKEFRCTILDIKNTDGLGLVMMFSDPDKKYDLKYENLNDNLKHYFSDEGDNVEKDCYFLNAKADTFIQSVQLNSHATEEDERKVLDICEKYKLKYVGKAKTQNLL